MVQKTNFNYDGTSENSLKTKQEVEDEKKNKLFLNGMLKRMNEKNYI